MLAVFKGVEINFDAAKYSRYHSGHNHLLSSGKPSEGDINWAWRRRIIWLRSVQATPETPQSQWKRLSSRKGAPQLRSARCESIISQKLFRATRFKTRGWTSCDAGLDGTFEFHNSKSSKYLQYGQENARANYDSDSSRQSVIRVVAEFLIGPGPTWIQIK